MSKQAFAIRIPIPHEGYPGMVLTLGSAKDWVIASLDGHDLVHIEPGQAADFISFENKGDGTVTYDPPKAVQAPRKIGWRYVKRHAVKEDPKP